MRVRAIDKDNDWTFGAGKQSYKVDAEAISQNVKTRLQSFRGDFFWNTEEGIDWFNLLEKGRQAELERALRVTVLTTEGVVAINSFEAIVNGRELNVSYNIKTIYSQYYVDDVNLQLQ